MELESTDPIVNDHLGDVLWMLGRKREAKFQWKKSLAFEPEPVDQKNARQIRVWSKGEIKKIVNSERHYY